MKDQLEKIEKRLACIEENTRLLLLSDVMRELDKSTDILEDKLLSEWLEQQRMTMEKLDTVNGQRLVYLSFLEKKEIIAHVVQLERCVSLISDLVRMQLLNNVMDDYDG